MHWLGLDIGTSSAKAIVVSQDGQITGRGAAGYGANQARHTVIDEQDPASWLEACRLAIERACGGDAANIEGIGIVGQTPTLVLVDDDVVPVRPAITWRDVRAEVEAEKLAREFGDVVGRVGTSLPWAAGNPLAKLRWLAEHDDGAMARTRWVLQPKDYVGAFLTGEAATDSWSSKGLVDVRDATVAGELLQACGWTTTVVPPVLAPWDRLGHTRSAPAAALGLPARIPVAVGWTDACAGMLALGVFHARRAFVFSGTSDIVGCSDTQLSPPALMSIPTTCAPRAVTYGPTQSSGAALEWAARLLDVDHEGLLRLAERSAPRRPVFLPYLLGERAPIWRSDLRGALLELTPEHRHAEIAYAVLEGVAMTARHILEVAGSTDEDVHLAPGTLGTFEPTLRLRTLGRKMIVHRERQISALGAAMLARACAGHDLRETVTLLEGDTELLAPNPQDVSTADAAWERFAHALSLQLATPPQTTP